MFVHYPPCLVGSDLRHLLKMAIDDAENISTASFFSMIVYLSTEKAYHESSSTTGLIEFISNISDHFVCFLKEDILANFIKVMGKL